MDIKSAFKGLLIDLNEIQNEISFDYVIIGGLAVGIWGYIRATKDIDILSDLKNELLNDFKDILQKKGYEIDIRRGDVFDPIPLLVRITIPEDRGGPAVADMLIVTRNWERQILKNKIQIKYEGLTVNLISVEDLILLKLKSGSPIDQVDAKEVFLINKDEIDIEELKNRARQMKIDRSLERFLKELSNN
ncbi:MAG: hypothetical protein D6726_11410 [Nitrospirae bacterium]|nr:MAG: hypothetical protein D6726_11410 [Nitrospirota bacterium]